MIEGRYARDYAHAVVARYSSPCEMASYFYTCSYPLRAGTIVEPGNWGRILGLSRIAALNLPLIREIVFEMVRIEKFPTKPNRLESAFVVEDLESAIRFRTAAIRGVDLIYRVELVDAEASSHRGCLSLLDFHGEDTIVTLAIKAEQYWNGADVQNPEVVTMSPLRIIEGPL